MQKKTDGVVHSGHSRSATRGVSLGSVQSLPKSKTSQQ